MSETPRRDKRRLIDELISTGVPAVAAAEAGKRRGRGLAIMYVVIPLLAIAVLLGVRESGRSETRVPDGGSAVDSGEGPGTQVKVSAENIAFDTSEVTLKPGVRTVIHFENRDASNVPHNVAIYEDADADDPVFQGEIIPGGTDIDYEFTAPLRGEYFFQCDVHPSMNGTVVVRS